MRSDILNENSNALLQANDKFDTFVKHAKVCNVTLANSLAAGDHSESWKQPANSIITNCYIVCTDAVTVASGDIGYDVGTSAHGEQLIAAQADEILDGGTDVAIGALTYPGMALAGPDVTGNDAADLATIKTAIDAKAVANGFVYDIQDDTSHVASVVYTGSERDIFCTITTSTDVTSTGGGNFAFCFEYLQFS